MAEQVFGGFPRELCPEEARLYYMKGVESGNEMQAALQINQLLYNARQQIDAILKAPGAAAQRIMAAENQHPNRLDILRKGCRPGGTTGVFSKDRTQASAATTTTQREGLFGSTAPQTSSAFGQSSALIQRPNPFGSTAATPAPDQVKTPAFTFGQPSKQPSKQPFVFGQSNQPTFTFGQPNRSTFTFGSRPGGSGQPVLGQPAQPANLASRQPSAPDENPKPVGALEPSFRLGSLPNPVKTGRLLTTPTRLFKLILPVHPRAAADGRNGDAGGGEDRLQPLALLVHPHQRLSYVRRLIQAELQPVVDARGIEHPPSVTFYAEDTAVYRQGKEKDDEQDVLDDEVKTAPPRDVTQGAKGHTIAESSGLSYGATHRKDRNWVRWCGNTTVGDLIRDVAQGGEFAVEIESLAPPSWPSKNWFTGEKQSQQSIIKYNIRIGVPSFSDRSHYHRQWLQRLSRKIDSLSRIKAECDAQAHQGSLRLAHGGFAAMIVS